MAANHAGCAVPGALRSLLVTDRGNERRLSFRNADNHIDLVLLVIQLDVEGTDARVGEPAIAVERLDSFEVGVERAAIEIGLMAPRQARSLFRLQGGREGLLVDLLDALEIEFVNRDVALLAASGRQEGNEEDQNGKKGACSRHGEVCSNTRHAKGTLGLAPIRGS
jgi:hypothetical protein